MCDDSVLLLRCQQHDSKSWFGDWSARKLRNSVSDWVGVSLWLQGQDVDVGVSSSLAVGVRCGGSDDGWNDRPSGEAL